MIYCNNIHLKITIIVIIFPGIPQEPAKIVRICIPELLSRSGITSSSPAMVPLSKDDVTVNSFISAISVEPATIKTLTNLNLNKVRVGEKKQLIVLIMKMLNT